MAYSVLLNIGIIALAYGFFASLNASQYLITAIAALSIILLVFLKIRLLKQIRHLTKEGDQKS